MSFSPDRMDMKILQILYVADRPESVWYVHNELGKPHGYSKTDSRVKRLHKNGLVEQITHTNGRKRYSIKGKRICRPGQSIIYFFQNEGKTIPAILHCEYLGHDCDCNPNGPCKLEEVMGINKVREEKEDAANK